MWIFLDDCLFTETFFRKGLNHFVGREVSIVRQIIGRSPKVRISAV